MPEPLLRRLVPDTVTPFAVLVPRCAPAPATGWLLVAPRGLSEVPLVVLLQADNASARATRTGAASARERDTGRQGIALHSANARWVRPGTTGASTTGETCQTCMT